MKILKKTSVILVSLWSVLTVATSVADEIDVPTLLSQSMAIQTQQVNISLALQLKQSIHFELEKFNTRERHFLLKPLREEITAVAQVMTKRINVMEE
jgi:hypothetical protein